MFTNRNGTIFENRMVVMLLSVLVMLLWGSAFPIVKLCSEGFRLESEDTSTRLLLAGVRFFLAGGIMVLLCLKTRQSLRIPNDRIVAVLLIGLLTTSMQYACNYIGLANISGGQASIWGQVSTFLVVLCAGLFDRSDRLTRRKLFGSLLGLAGIVATNFSIDSHHFRWEGEGLLLFGAVGSAAGALISKRVLRTIEGAPLAAWQMLIGGSVLLFLGFSFNGEIHGVDALGVFSMLYLIIVSIVAYTIWMLLAKYRPLSEISMFKFGIPLSGVLVSGALTGDRIFSISNLVSLLLVMVGILLVYHTPDSRRNGLKVKT